MFRSSLRSLAFTLTALAAAVAAPASAVAAGTPTGPYTIFQYCPLSNANVQDCFAATITSGAFKIGNAQVPVTVPILMQGGVSSAFLSSPVYDAVGAPTMSPSAQPVPGGLLGLMNPDPSWPGPLWNLFWNIVNSANGVTATAEPVGPAQAYLSQALVLPPAGEDPTVLHLPIRVHLQNPFLGNNCYIGSAANPIVLNVQAGTTSPPPPNKPITGVLADFNVVGPTNADGTGFIIQANNSTLVDNAFAAPAASGCGNTLLNIPIITPLFQGLITAAVNLKEGLPSAAGKNSVSLTGSTVIATPADVESSEQ